MESGGAAVAAVDGLAMRIHGLAIEQEAGGRTVTMRLVESSGRRPVGWGR